MATRGRIALAAVTFAVLAGVAAACAGSPARTDTARDTATAALESWGRDHADVFARLSYDVSTVADYASTYNIPALGGACQAVRQEVQAYLALPPIPSVVAAGYFRSALDLFGRGTGDCIDGTTRGDDALIVRAASELNRATRELNATRSALDPASAR